MGQGPARAECSVQRRLGNGGQPHDPEAVCQRDRGQVGRQRHVHGQAVGQAGRVELPRALEPVAGGPQCVCGAGEGGSIEGSGTFLKFLAGWLAHAPEVMVFYAPNVNSYKRYQTGSWAPTHLAWSRDNRTAGFRVVGSSEGLRIECRIPGADCNPYLVYAAALASGLDGIANDMRPPAEFRGDAYHASELPHVPRTLSEAIG